MQLSRWVNQLFYLVVLEQLLCTSLPYSFVDLSLVRCVAVMNVFAGTEACYMAVGHHGHSSSLPNTSRFPVHSGLKQEGFVILALEYITTNVQEHRAGLKSDGTHQLLVSADDENLSGDDVNTIKKNHRSSN
jgi:hypothetical protein